MASQISAQVRIKAHHSGPEIVSYHRAYTFLFERRAYLVIHLYLCESEQPANSSSLLRVRPPRGRLDNSEIQANVEIAKGWADLQSTTIESVPIGWLGIRHVQMAQIPQAPKDLRPSPSLGMISQGKSHTSCHKQVTPLADRLIGWYPNLLHGGIPRPPPGFQTAAWPWLRPWGDVLSPGGHRA